MHSSGVLSTLKSTSPVTQRQTRTVQDHSGKVKGRKITTAILFQIEHTQVKPQIHSLNSFLSLLHRVIGAIVNSRDFSEAFQCKEGSAMNPEDKCELW